MAKCLLFNSTRIHYENILIFLKLIKHFHGSTIYSEISFLKYITRISHKEDTKKITK